MKASELINAMAGGPGGQRAATEQRRRHRHADHPPDRPEILLLHEGTLPPRLTAHRNRRWIRVVARLFGPSLDGRLAAGCPPESQLLLAGRAQILVSPAMRQSLVRSWADLLGRARTRPLMRDPRAPINRDSIMANEPEIRELLRTMSAETPIDVRGIAIMSSMLTDGSGPLYNHQRADELKKALCEVSTRWARPALFSDVA